MNNPHYRPPAEANSLILQIDEGCPYNHCTFCAMYSGVPYIRRNMDEIETIISSVHQPPETVKRIFLADGDVMLRPYEQLTAILQMLNARFPEIARINTYATGTAIIKKTDPELAALRDLKLHTLYMGLESGDQETTERVHKGETVREMVEAARRAQSVGLHMSVMVLLGLAGTALTTQHAHNTAVALNKMQPRLLSCLRIVPVPTTSFADAIANGELEQLSEYGAIQELLNMVTELELRRTVFRANHSSNVVPIEARLPRGKEQLVNELRALLDSGRLDRFSPGPMPTFL